LHHHDILFEPSHPPEELGGPDSSTAGLTGGPGHSAADLTGGPGHSAASLGAGLDNPAAQADSVLRHPVILVPGDGGSQVRNRPAQYLLSGALYL
jgi:hypothetical protein